MTNNQDAYAEIKCAIGGRVREAMQREPASLLAGEHTKSGILDQKFNKAPQVCPRPRLALYPYRD